MWWALGALVFFFVDGGGDISDPVDSVIEGFTDVLARITRGKRLTRSTFDKATGAVLESPTALAAQAGAPLEAYALARMISSEESTGTNLHRAAVAAAAVNYANAHGVAISTLLTRNKQAAKVGRFGSQAGGYASTRQDPYEGDLEIALGVLDGSIPDPTGGADHWDVPSGEDAAAVAANRAASGLVPYAVEGIDPSALRFWGPAVLG